MCVFTYLFFFKNHSEFSRMSTGKKVFSLTSKQHGSGDTPVHISWQPKQGTYLAVVGSNRTLFIYDRHGSAVEKLPLLDNVADMAWDKEGDLLAVICEKMPIIILWDSNRRKLSQIDSSFKDSMSYLGWCKTSCLLAVGTTKGNLLLYNHLTSKKIPILGKHTRRVTTGAWSKDGLLALGGDDRMLTISNEFGDTMRHTVLKDTPSLIMFSDRKQDVRSQLSESTVSLVLNRKTLYLYCVDDPDSPVELAFQQKYGDIINYQWYGDGYIMIGFSNGYLIVVSTHAKEIGTELFQTRAHKNYLADMAVSKTLYKAASCGDNCIKVYDLQDIKDVETIINVDDQNFERLVWSEDGQLLALSTTNGAVHVYLTKLPLLASVLGHRIAYMTSLNEIALYDHSIKSKSEPLNLAIHIEPTYIALGQSHFVVGFNNRAWFYTMASELSNLFFFF